MPKKAEQSSAFFLCELRSQSREIGTGGSP